MRCMLKSWTAVASCSLRRASQAAAVTAASADAGKLLYSVRAGVGEGNRIDWPSQAAAHVNTRLLQRTWCIQLRFACKTRQLFGRQLCNPT